MKQKLNGEKRSPAKRRREPLGTMWKPNFSVPAGMSTVIKGVIKSGEDDFLNVSYIPTARLIQINTGGEKQRDGFLHRCEYPDSGKKETATPSSTEGGEEIKRVKILTYNTASSLYLEPVKALNLSPEGVVTIQYAIKRAIENLYQVESSELAVTLIGNPATPNIFIYESAEGSLGILSRFIEEHDTFIRVVNEAYSLCRFDNESYLAPASYDDLLSYYNQRDHERISRFSIKEALENLMKCNFVIMSNSSFSSMMNI
jgi:hypothetical protein